MPQATKPIPFEVGREILSTATRQDDGCWATDAPINSGNGYSYSMGYLAHRAAWTAANERQIRQSFVIDHICFNRQCVNPEHLRELSRRENSMRKTGDAWPLGTCKWGHPDSERVTVYWKSRAERTECGACRREVNTAQTQWRGALRRLELTYGIALTRRQQAMVDDFLPQQSAAA